MTGLDLARLANVRQRGEGIQARCPACGESGSDRSGNHLRIAPDGRFGCAVRPDDREHRRRIWQLVGGETIDRGDYLPPVPRPSAPEALQTNEWPELETGSNRDLRALAALRGIGVSGLELASDRGILRFYDDHHNGRCWALADSRRHVRQDRRLDGRPFQLRDGRLTKARTLGRPAWPIGAGDLGEAENVLFCEGGPDLLSAWHLVWGEGRGHDTAPVAMLGAGQPIHPGAVELFRGKRVRFFPHADKAGRNAVAKWWRELDVVASGIDAFQFDGLVQESGEPAYDLNDFLDTSTDQWERLAYVRSPLP